MHDTQEPDSCRGPYLGEDHHRVDTVRAGLCNLVQQAILPSEAVHTGHGVDGDVLLAVVHKDGEDEVGGADDALLDSLTDSGAATVAARAGQDVL
jgi:hypothetical protein